MAPARHARCALSLTYLYKMLRLHPERLESMVIALYGRPRCATGARPACQVAPSLFASCVLQFAFTTPLHPRCSLSMYASVVGWMMWLNKQNRAPNRNV